MCTAQACKTHLRQSRGLSVARASAVLRGLASCVPARFCEPPAARFAARLRWLEQEPARLSLVAKNQQAQTSQKTIQRCLFFTSQHVHCLFKPAQFAWHPARILQGNGTAAKSHGKWSPGPVQGSLHQTASPGAGGQGHLSPAFRDESPETFQRRLWVGHAKRPNSSPCCTAR